MTDAISSFGTLLQQGDGGTPETFTTVAEVMDITGPSLVRDTEEVTNHSSTNAWKEYIPTLRDGGEVTFDINYVPTGSTHDATTGILADWEDGTLRNWQLVWPDTGSTTWSFPGYVTNFEPSANVNGALRASITILLSGDTTIA